MNKSDKLNVKVKIGLKSFITVISILFIVLIAVGILMVSTLVRLQNIVVKKK